MFPLTSRSEAADEVCVEPSRRCHWLLACLVLVVCILSAAPTAQANGLPPGTTTYVILPSSPAAMTIDPATRTIYYADRNDTGVLRRVAPDLTVSMVTPDFTPTGSYSYPATDIQFSNGAVYTTLTNGALVKIVVATGASTIVQTLAGFGSFSGLAMGGSKLYVTDGTGAANQLREYDPATGIVVNRISGLPASAFGLEYDAPRNKMYFATGTSRFYRADVVAGTFTQISTAPSGLGNFAVDPNGLYLYARVGSTILRITIADGTYTTYASGLSGDDSYDLVFGPSSSGSGSSLYAGDSGRIYEIPGFVAAGTTSVGPRTLLNNGSFENGMIGWEVSEISAPLLSVASRPNGYSPGYGLFLVAATEGVRAATHGFDGHGPGVIGIAQDVPVTVDKPYLAFDYRVGWDMQGFGATLPRIFRVVVRQNHGGPTLQSTTVLTADANTRTLDTGAQTGVVDLTAYAGSTVQVSFEAEIPQSTTGPGFFQLDNVGMAALGSVSQSPQVVTGNASNITVSGALLNGTVNANGLATTVQFQFGLTSSYGKTVTATFNPNNGTVAKGVSQAVSGLLAGTTYHFRIVATNGGGTVAGDDETFVTLGPTVTTGAATNIAWTAATLNATLNPNGKTTVADFEYGTTPDYGSSVTLALSPKDGSVPQDVSATIGGLLPATNYHFRLIAFNPDGTQAGNDATFSTGGGMVVTTTVPVDAGLTYPHGLAMDGDGNVYVTETAYHTIRKVTPDGDVSLVAGQTLVIGTADGPGSGARFNQPEGLAIDGTGNLYVADLGNQTIRKITPDGVVSTLAGTAGVLGTADGTGGDAQFNWPTGVAVDGTGNVYVADRFNHAIRKITPDRVVTTLAGSPGISGTADGTGTDAQFNQPISLTVDAAGNVYVSDGGNSTIRKVTPDGTVTTLAGSAGSLGHWDGPGDVARFYSPLGVAVDGAGSVYVADSSNNTIRKISPGGVVSTVAGKYPALGTVDGIGDAARFSDPTGLFVRGSDVFVADQGNSVVRKLSPQGNSAPVVSLLGAALLEFEASANYGDPGATAFDAQDGILAPIITANTVVANQPGNYAVTWATTDGAGLTGTATRVVRVVDTTPPAITVPANLIVPAAGANGAVVNYTTSAIDIVSGVVPTTNVPVSGSLFPTGATLVTVAATDALGNVGTNSFTVTVVPAIAPYELLGPPISVADGNVNVSVAASVPGRSYQLQACENLAGGVWQDVGAPLLGTGQDLMISVPFDPGLSQCFYRLKLK